MLHGSIWCVNRKLLKIRHIIHKHIITYIACQSGAEDPAVGADFATVLF